MKEKVTSVKIATLAGKALRDPTASKIQKSLAAGALSQRNPNRQTGTKLEKLAAKALESSKYNELTKSLAGTVLTQSK
jgi:hypothetical protein